MASDLCGGYVIKFTVTDDLFISIEQLQDGVFLYFYAVKNSRLLYRFYMNKFQLTMMINSLHSSMANNVEQNEFLLAQRGKTLRLSLSREKTSELIKKLIKILKDIAEQE